MSEPPIDETDDTSTDDESPDESPPAVAPWRDWSLIHLIAVTAGWSALAVLVWGLIEQLDQWSARPFVMLLYTAVVCAIVASFAARRGGGGTWGWLPRRLLLTLVVVALLWAWFPPTQRLVGWIYRQVALYFLQT